MQQMMKPKGIKNDLKFFKPKSTKIERQHRELTQQGMSQAMSSEEEQTGCICMCGDPGCRIGPYVPDNNKKGRR